jgi:hypothetical protein
MSYIPLQTDAAPRSIRDFVRLHVDMQMHDVHTMLRLPLERQAGMEGGCNFASVAVLCAVIVGASTVFFRQDGTTGSRFREVLREHYPWLDEPRGGVEPSIRLARAAITGQSSVRSMLLPLSGVFQNRISWRGRMTVTVIEIFQVAGAVLASIGGAGALLWGLSSVLARVWGVRPELVRQTFDATFGFVDRVAILLQRDVLRRQREAEVGGSHH